MKKGIRFQTRLMLAFLVACSVVTIAVIQLTSAKVKQSYRRQFKAKFDAEIHFLVQAREKRAEDQAAEGKRIASSNYIVTQLLSGEKFREFGKQRRQFMAGLPSQSSINADSGGPGMAMEQDRSKSSPIVAVMDTTGEIFYLTDPLKNRAARKGRIRGANIQKQLELLNQSQKPQIAYIPIPHNQQNGVTIIRDFSITPVKNPANGQVIGASLMSLSALETSAEKLLDRYHKEISTEHVENAIFVDGALYPSSVLGAMRREVHQDFHYCGLETGMQTKLDSFPQGKYEGNFELKIHGDPHYVHFCALNRESPLPTAWQVAASPMTELQKDLNDLRIKGSGIGALGILLGMITAWFLSRKLAVPIRNLSEGTRRIGDGQFDLQLPVRSGDEIGELTTSFNKMAAELLQKEHYRSLLSKVSDESVAQAMIEGTLNPRLGGENKTVSVLFCDIREFSSLTETMQPGEVIELLNRHMTALTKVVQEYDGVVDKFMGDEIMAVFGGLKSGGNDAVNASLCAMKMMSERERLNREIGTDIQIGIGIATGEVVTGCMGSEDRLNYTVLGAKVNLGARLCGRAGPGEIVIDDQTFAGISDLQPETEPIEGLLLKGFSIEVPAWKLFYPGNLNVAATVGPSSVINN